MKKWRRKNEKKNWEKTKPTKKAEDTPIGTLHAAVGAATFRQLCLNENQALSHAIRCFINKHGGQDDRKENDTPD